MAQEFAEFERSGWSTRGPGYARGFGAYTARCVPSLLDAVEPCAGRLLLDVGTGPLRRYRDWAGDAFFRLSIGLEDPDGLCADLDRALSVLSPRSSARSSRSPTAQTNHIGDTPQSSEHRAQRGAERDGNKCRS